jgi:hypothetical protein
MMGTKNWVITFMRSLGTGNSKFENRKWKLENGNPKLENGNPKFENGNWRVVSLVGCCALLTTHF